MPKGKFLPIRKGSSSILVIMTIFEIVEKLKKAEFFDDQTTKSFAVGLKLFSEVMLENRDHPLFQEFLPQFGQFMKNLKQQVKTQSP